MAGGTLIHKIRLESEGGRQGQTPLKTFTGERSKSYSFSVMFSGCHPKYSTDLNVLSEAKERA